MDWVDRLQICKGLYGILQLLQGSHLDNFLLNTLKLGWVHVAFHSLTFQLKCLDFQSNQQKKLAQALSFLQRAMECHQVHFASRRNKKIKQISWQCPGFQFFY